MEKYETEKKELEETVSSMKSLEVSEREKYEAQIANMREENVRIMASSQEQQELLKTQIEEAEKKIQEITDNCQKLDEQCDALQRDNNALDEEKQHLSEAAKSFRQESQARESALSAAKDDLEMQNSLLQESLRSTEASLNDTSRALRAEQDAHASLRASSEETVTKLQATLADTEARWRQQRGGAFGAEGFDQHAGTHCEGLGRSPAHNNTYSRAAAGGFDREGRTMPSTFGARAGFRNACKH